MSEKIFNLTRIRWKLENMILDDIPNFEIVSKTTSFLMKVLSVLLFFNKSFMTSYISVIYPRMYVPKLPWKENDHYSAILVLAHEWVHLSDRKRFGLLFDIGYLFPQCLAFLSLLAPFLSVWWLLCLLFLLPIPSPTRAWLEFRGYSMTMACKWWLTGNEINYYWIERQFVGQWYYFMWPFKGIVRKMFEKQMEKIKNDDLSPEQRKVKEIIFS
jgi:hypothetical protein